jgi:hypothetical protein
MAKGLPGVKHYANKMVKCYVEGGKVKPLPLGQTDHNGIADLTKDDSRSTIDGAGNPMGDAKHHQDYVDATRKQREN